MTDFSKLTAELLTSAHAICERADVVVWEGEGWSPNIIIGHLIDVDQEVWLPRFAMMVEAWRNHLPIPKLSWWEPDPVKTSQKYSNSTLTQATELLLISRETMSDYLLKLSSHDLSAQAEHATFGRITIESMLQIILNHDKEHLASLH